MKQKKGFTLIELLVVIAIIAILAAILFPVFAKVREKARQTSCLSNEKQLGLSIAQYTDDYDEKSPNASDPYGRASGWAWQVYPYVKSTGVFICPDDSGVGNSNGDHGSSYGLNNNTTIQQSPNVANGNNSHSQADYTSPSRTVLIFEVANSTYYDLTSGSPTQKSPVASDYVYNGGSAAGTGLGNADYDPNGANSEALAGASQGDGHLKYATGYLRYSAQSAQFLAPTGRHTDGSNFLMADFHAKWMRGSSVTAGGNNATAGDNGSQATSTAANTGATDGTIAATFSIQ